GDGEGANDPSKGGFAPSRRLPPGFVAPAKPALGSGTLPRRGPITDQKSLRRAFGVPRLARVSPAQASGCSPRTAGPEPRDVLRLALRPGGRFRRGPPRSPPIERRRWALIHRSSPLRRRSGAPPARRADSASGASRRPG